MEQMMEQKLSPSDAVVELLKAVRLTTQQVFGQVYGLSPDAVDRDIYLGTEWAGGSWGKDEFGGCEPSTVVVVHTENGLPDDTAGSDCYGSTPDGSIELTYEGRYEDSWYYVRDLLAPPLNAQGYGVGWEAKNMGLHYFYLDDELDDAVEEHLTHE
jgi:hypothetical protein